MAEFKPTQGQQWAIEARDSALLVSAAAGSGKTKVLTERLMSYITQDDPKSIDSFLIITYTRAAAGELRSRIMSELTTRMAQEPDNLALRRQYALVSRAQISTIHGFCSALIRENCLALELTPDFKVVDETRTAAMKQAALDSVLESCYERLEQDEALRQLIDTVGAGRDDQRLADLLLTLHTKMQSHAYPAVWAEKQKQGLKADGITDPGETIWGRYLLDNIGQAADYWARTMEQLLGFMEQPGNEDILKKCAGNLAETADGLRNFAAATKLGWDKAVENAAVPFPRWPTVKEPNNPDALAKIKELRETCKKSCKKLEAELSQTAEEVLDDMRKVAPAMEALLDLTMEFDQQFAADKKRRGVVDYADLEHFAAQLLSDTDGNPTELAKQLSQRYTEIMVDEYQDVNEVQELIFRCISKDETNLFTVGDVKQSIYRFRLADPTIFTGKYLSYTDYEQAQEGQPRRILLRENFRSRKEILDGANAVFDNIMSTRLGELEYDDNARLRCGASYEGEVPLPKLSLIEVGGDDTDDEEEPSTSAEIEAAYVAQAIRNLVDSGTLVTQGGTQRPARYDDIAILMRSANKMVNVYRKALNKMGIPVQSEQGGGFYTSPEITVMMALMSIVDNPRQDVPLISVLQSVYVGFTPDELAQVRACNKKATFYEALEKCAETDERSAAFLKKLNTWRNISGELPLRDLIWRIMDDLSVMAVTSAMEDGQLRCRNLMAFADLATQFESTGFRGLRRFVVWLNRQAESGIEPEVHCGDSGNAVQIMSVHKSKGLEFPIVFLCDTSRRFNKSDNRDTVLVHPEMGLGPKIIDVERGIEYQSMPRRAITRKMNLETLSEEMRLLYVAMTRAKEYLFMTGTVKNAEKKLEKLRILSTSPVSPQILETASSLSDWLISAYYADNGEHLQLEKVIWKAETAEETGVQEECETVAADEEMLRQIRSNLAYTYPHAISADLPSKLTATELKHLWDDVSPDAAPMISMRNRQFRSFRAGGEEERLSAAEKGIATHLVFQHIDYKKALSLESVQEEIARLKTCGILNAQQAKSVDARQIARFFMSETGKLMRDGDSVLREFKFSLLRPASVFFPGADDDEILLQGVIDCAVEKDGAYTIIDYKTDAVNEQTVQERAAIYASQVQAYANAMHAITGKPVAKTILYFLKPGISVEIS